MTNAGTPWTNANASVPTAENPQAATAASALTLLPVDKVQGDVASFRWKSVVTCVMKEVNWMAGGPPRGWG